MARTRRWWMVWLPVAAAAIMVACSGDTTAPATPASDPAAAATDSTTTSTDSTATSTDSTTTPSDSSGSSSGGSSSSSGTLLGVVSGFVQCQAQPYATKTVTIGPLGGVIQVNGHKLTVPAGALGSTVAITMEAPSDTIRSVRFSPEGLTFNSAYRPVLDMDYHGCTLLSLLPKKIVYTDEQFTLLQQLLSLDLLSLFKVEAKLDHFSRYAIHY